MPVTLTSLLARDDLALRLLGGAVDGVEVTWAHAIEVQDPRPWLSGGELVLTTGLRLPRAVTEQAAYVDRMAEVGVAALAFGVGVRFEAVPRGIRSRCAELGVPLLEVPLPTPFIAISQAVAQQLARQQQDELQQVVDFQRSLTRTTLRSGVTGLTRALARELHCAVVLADEHGVVRAVSPDAQALAVRVGAELAGRAGQASRGSGLALLDDGAVELHQLAGGTSRRGWLAVAREVPLTPGERVLLHHAASLATLHLDRPRELEQARGQVGGTVLRMLLDTEDPPRGTLDHLGHFGFRMTDEVRLVLVQAETSPALASSVQARLTDVGHPHVHTDTDLGHAVLVRATDADGAVEQVLQALGTGGHPGATVGVSGAVALREVATALPAAHRAAQSARRGSNRVGWFDALTLEAVLADDAVQRSVRALAQSTLAPLSGTPALDALELPESLDAFLQHHGAWEPAARALGVHRHTLRNRMARVEELTGMSLEVADNRVVLALALATRPGGWAPSVRGGRR